MRRAALPRTTPATGLARLARLTVALFLVAITGCSAAPFQPYGSTEFSNRQGPYVVPGPSYQTADHGTPPHYSANRDDFLKTGHPFVVLGSGRRLPYNTHRRMVGLLNSKAPVSVQLPSGQTLQFTDCEEFLRKAPTSHLEGGQFVIPSENWPVEIAQEVMETERALQARVELPTGQTVFYHDYVRAAPGTPSYPPRHLEQPPAALPPSCSLDIPDDNLFIMLGNGQRLMYKVHEAIHCHYSRKLPYDVRLATGEREKVATYDELIKKLLEPRFMDCAVWLAPDVSVPIETYRAVVDAHRHGVVYVEYPDGRRVPYSEYSKHREMDKKDAFARDLAKQEHLGQDSGADCTGYAARRRAAKRRIM